MVKLHGNHFWQDKFRNMIADEYLVNWMVDNLPAATKYSQTGSGSQTSCLCSSEGWTVRPVFMLRPSGSDFAYMNGFLLGIAQKGKYYLHNHVSLDGLVLSYVCTCIATDAPHSRTWSTTRIQKSTRVSESSASRHLLTSTNAV